MTGEKSTPLVINGWTIFAHPLFLDQIEELVRQVESHKKKKSVRIQEEKCFEATGSHCQARIRSDSPGPYAP